MKLTACNRRLFGTLFDTVCNRPGRNPERCVMKLKPGPNILI